MSVRVLGECECWVSVKVLGVRVGVRVFSECEGAG